MCEPYHNSSARQHEQQPAKQQQTSQEAKTPVSEHVEETTEAQREVVTVN